ncbi:MAG: GNAT family N-acetyltransferase [Gaiellales bacterium]
MRIREIESAELPALVHICRAVRPSDPVSPADFEDWKRQAEGTIWYLAEGEDGPAGAGIGVVGWHTPPGRGIVELYTLPEARGRGAGSALLEGVTSWARARDTTELTASVAEDDPASLAWAARRGFEEIGRNKRVELELTGFDPPSVDPPEGIEIVQWSVRPGIERGLYAVYCEAEPDIPGEEANELATFEDWLSADMQGVSDRPEATFAALAGEEVVGFAKLSILGDAEATTAYHDLTGVRRAWRGRGIAGALKRAQIGWAKANGFERLATANEERNLPIRALNRRYGYRPVPGTITLLAAIGA